MPRGWDDTAADGPVEVVIGMTWDQLWRLARHPWVALSTARMVAADRDAGLVDAAVSVRPRGPVLITRWASRAALDAWARDAGEAHAGPWARFRREAGETASWGLWHEVRDAPEVAEHGLAPAATRAAEAERPVARRRPAPATR